MNRYNLYILAHNSFNSNVLADYFTIENECIYFYKKDKLGLPAILEAVYPAQFTIIKSIDYDLK